MRLWAPNAFPPADRPGSICGDDLGQPLRANGSGHGRHVEFVSRTGRSGDRRFAYRPGPPGQRPVEEGLAYKWPVQLRIALHLAARS